MIYFTTTHRFTAPVTKLYPRHTVCFLEDLHNLKSVWLQRKNVVDSCTDDLDTPVSFDNRLKDFNGTLSIRAPILYNVSPETECHVCPRFLFDNGPIFRNLFTVWCSFDCEGIETHSKFPRTLLVRLLPSKFPQSKSCYIQQVKLDCATSDGEMYPEAAIILVVFESFRSR
jgi:hypothetical protein